MSEPVTTPLRRVRNRRPQRRWRHRIPVRLRHYWRPVALIAAFLALSMGVFGTARVVPYITGDDLYEAPVVTQDIAGAMSLFDTSTSHSLQLTFAQIDYERILQEWYDEGEKEYLEADLVLDGTLVEDVGVRLKGNSTLMGLSDPDDPDGGRRRGGMQAPEGVKPPVDAAAEGAGEGQPAEAGEGAGGQRMGGLTSVALSEEEPENLPWLISFDEFAEGRRYQGHSEIAVRPASGSSTFATNEALALALIAQTGQVGQDFTYSTFTVNDRPTTSRLLVEHPDEPYAEEEFATDGVLYKSLAGSSFTDQGDDPTEYADDFEQINRIGSQDLQPVIDLIHWATSAGDEEFAAELGEHLDVDSFARYLATQNLLLNSDDMAGPGSNYYLYYDLDTEKFEVIAWDLNLTFGGSTDSGPHDSVGMGGPGGRDRPGPDEQAVDQQVGDQQTADQQAGEQRLGGPGMRAGNALKERFLATPAFAEVYENAYRELYQQIYADGGAMQVLDQLTATVPVADGLDAATITADIDALRQTVTARTDALADDPVITETAP